MIHLKIAVVILNISMLATFGWFFADKGLPKGDDLWLAFLIFAAPIANLTYVWFGGVVARGEMTDRLLGKKNTKDDPSLLALEVEVRKARLRKELRNLESGETQ